MVELNPALNIRFLLSSAFSSRNCKLDESKYIFTSRGRDAINFALKALKYQKNDILLLPALNCNTVVREVKAKCKVKFYDLDKDLEPNYEHIEELLDLNKNVKGVYLIHYFGVLSSTRSIFHKFCKEHKLQFWEDHAHSAICDRKFEDLKADVEIFSFRKLLPIPDGGAIVFNNSRHNYDLTFSAFSRVKANLFALLIVIKRFLYGLSLFRRRIGALTNRHSMKDNKPNKIILPSSIFAKRIICNYDFILAKERRRRLYSYWKELFKETRVELVIPNLKDSDAPHCFPIYLHNNKFVKDQLRKKNILLKIHWENHFRSSKKATCYASMFSKKVISLPIYPGLKKNQMREIKDLIINHGEFISEK